MAEIVQEKGRGLKFAEQQLLRHGWEQGKGLGRQGDGISEAIKVKVKCDKGGVGHKQGEQFTYHWWDHVFNKASASLQVESDQNGVTVKKTVEEDEEGMISNKKPTKAKLAKAKLYGCFVKSATLLSGQEQPEPKSSPSDDSSSSEDEDQKLDLSSATQLSDADLMKVCGGRTAHKGARHGVTMSAKLARLERQEAEFMAKYGNKSQSANSSPVCVTPTTPSAAQSPERQEETPEASRSKKTKKKSTEDISERTDMDTKTKKKKKKKREKQSNESSEGITVAFPTETQESNPVEMDGAADHSRPAKKKHKRKEKIAEENRETSEAATPAEGESSEQTADASSSTQQTASDVKTKRKKSKSSKHRGEPPVPAEGVMDTAPGQSEPSRKEADAVIVDGAESRVKQKRKKCKEAKRSGGVNEGELPPKKKKRKH